MYDSKEETLKHIRTVEAYIDILKKELTVRQVQHDVSKLVSPEKEIFDEMTPRLKASTYGSEEYQGFLMQMQVALDHHYKKNRHHPEHFPNGVSGMTLIDVIEMLCDWKAATLRHADGDIRKSIEINQKRFGYSDELKQIFLNTIEIFD